MDRRWRGQQGKGALSTLQSFHTYRAQLPVLAAGLGVADPADVYATHSCLHATGKRTQVLCSPEQTLLYLVVKPQAAQGEMQAGASGQHQDVVVPVSASYPHLTPSFLSSLFGLSQAEPACVVLAVVDGDGTVVLNRLYQGIHAPSESLSGVDASETGKASSKQIQQ